MAAKAWHLLPHDPDRVRRLAGELRVSPVVAQLLINRDVVDAASARLFLDAPLSGLHAPQLLPGVPEAAEKIAEAIRAGKPICVYGDYDADGVTGTALLLRALRALGGNVRFYVPHRLDEGYGLNADAVEKLADDGVKLLITVDCGIGSVAEAVVAKRKRLDLIVTDHHEMKSDLPDATLVHPRLPGSRYPFGELSGAGVALKLAWAVAQRVTGKERVPPEMREVLMDGVGLAALGLVADVVPLRDENRVLVRHGLDRLARNPFTGIQALIGSSRLAEKKELRAEDIAFRLAPRLNAAGRLGCARLVVDLLTTPHPPKAKELADYLETQNVERQGKERKIAQHARELVEAEGLADAPAIVLGSADWHSGVVGIVAGRLAEQFGRPVLLAALKPYDAVSTGSGRSVAGFELHKALERCSDLLEGHGGHAAAAGFKVRPSKLAALRERFAAVATERFPAGPVPVPLRLDAEVPLSALTRGLLADIDKLEPYGANNPRPRFLAAELKLEGVPRRIGQGERHLSFRVRQGGTQIRAVAWGMGERLDELVGGGGDCCLAFTPKLNEWNGQSNVEVEVTDFQARGRPEMA